MTTKRKVGAAPGKGGHGSRRRGTSDGALKVEEVEKPEKSNRRSARKRGRSPEAAAGDGDHNTSKAWVYDKGLDKWVANPYFSKPAENRAPHSHASESLNKAKRIAKQDEVKRAKQEYESESGSDDSSEEASDSDSDDPKWDNPNASDSETSEQDEEEEEPATAEDFPGEAAKGAAGGGHSLKRPNKSAKRKLEDQDSPELQTPVKIKRTKFGASTMVKTEDESRLKIEEDPEPKLNIKMVGSPQSLVKIIPRLTEAQTKAVVDMGFGGLLSMKLEVCHHPLTKWLLARFNTNNRVVYKQRGQKGSPLFEVGWADVRDVFMLPHSRKQVLLTGGDAEILKIRNRWNKQYNMNEKTGGVCKFGEVMLRIEDGGPDFKRMFVLYAMSSFLAATTNRNVRWTIMPSLLDVDEIGSYDWCEYVLSFLCDSIESYRKESTKVSKGQYHLGGCPLLLELCYLHRQPWRTESVPRSLPLIQWWTTQGLKDRVFAELKSGGYGKGILRAHLFPISATDSSEEEIATNDAQKWATEMESAIKRCSQEPCSAGNFEKDVFLFSRDLNTLLNYHSPIVNGYSNLQPGTSTSRKRLSLEEHAASMMLDRFSKISLIFRGLRNTVEAFIDRGEGVQTVKVPSEAETKKSALVSEVPNDTGGVSAEQQGIQTEVLSAGDLNANGKEVSLQVEMISEQWSQEKNKVETQKASLSLKELLKRLQDIPPVHLSSKLAKGQLAREQSSDYKTHVVDFCLSRNENPDTIFSDGAFAFLVPNDISTLEEDTEINSSVLVCWARYLNSTKSEDRVCLEVVAEGVEPSHTAWYKEWDDFLKSCGRQITEASLIILPVQSNGHHFTLVANLDSQLLFYIDNLLHKENLGSWMKLVKEWHEALADYLITRKHTHPGAKNVINFPVVTVSGKWKEATDNNDSGVYSMYFMEHFAGTESEINKLPLRKKSQREEHRYRVCEKLVLSDLNTKKLDVLQATLDWVEKKQAEALE